MASTLGIQEAAEKFDLKEATDAIKDKATNTAQAIGEAKEAYKERIAEKFDDVKIKVSDNLSGAAESVHSKSDAAQEFLLDKTDKANSYAHEATDRVNAYAHQTIERANSFGHRAANAIDASSGYVRDFDLAQTRDQVVQGIRQNPGISIAVAGVLGLLVGILVGSSTRR